MQQQVKDVVMSITIQRLKKEDIALALALIEVWTVDDDQKEKRENKPLIENMLSDKNFHVLVAISGGNIIGGLTAYTLEMLYGQGNKLFLYEVEVEKTHRRKGVGSMLIKALKELGSALHIKSIFLCTDIDNTAAQKLYRKMGGDEKPQRMYSFKL